MAFRNRFNSGYLVDDFYGFDIIGLYSNQPGFPINTALKKQTVILIAAYRVEKTLGTGLQTQFHLITPVGCALRTICGFQNINGIGKGRDARPTWLGSAQRKIIKLCILSD